MSIPLPEEILPSQPKQVQEGYGAVGNLYTYQWTPEQVKEYLAKKYGVLPVPQGKKPMPSWTPKAK